MVLIAAVECGGTSFKVAVCRPDGTVVERFAADSSPDDPTRTLGECADFLRQFASSNIAALGIATFGPVGVREEEEENSETYGRILQSSPKASWRGVDLLTPLRDACGHGRRHGAKVRCFVETDVNAPAYAEYLEARKTENPTISSCAYVTVGTGVGVGLVVNHRTVHGRMHPEGGHVPVPPLEGDNFQGYSWGRRKGSSCPFGGVNTVEGLASSVALTERWEQQLQQADGGSGNNNSSTDAGAAVASGGRHVLQDLPDDCVVWDHAANALAGLCTTLLLTLSVEKIVLGGGVMRRGDVLLEQIRQRTAQQLNGYLDLGGGDGEDDVEALRSIITTSRHGDDAGLVGAIVLAQRALGEKTEDDEESKKLLKQVAFKTGLWHGFLVGAVTAALVFKYGLFGIGGRGGRSRR